LNFPTSGDCEDPTGSPVLRPFAVWQDDDPPSLSLPPLALQPSTSALYFSSRTTSVDDMTRNPWGDSLPAWRTQSDEPLRSSPSHRATSLASPNTRSWLSSRLTTSPHAYSTPLEPFSPEPASPSMSQLARNRRISPTPPPPSSMTRRRMYALTRRTSTSASTSISEHYNLPQLVLNLREAAPGFSSHDTTGELYLGPFTLRQLTAIQAHERLQSISATLSIISYAVARTCREAQIEELSPFVAPLVAMTFECVRWQIIPVFGG